MTDGELYFPTAQLVQLTLSSALYLPDTQLVHFEEPALALYVPAKHFTHTVALTALLYLPAGQLVHWPVPLAAANLPATHGWQPGKPAWLYLPASQTTHVLAPEEPNQVATKPAFTFE